MGKLNGLINGQDVAFDTHQSGDGQETNWENVHLEKRLHGKRGKARYPLLGDEEPSNSGMNDRDFSRVTREVKRELKKNSNLLNELAETIVNELERFSNGTATIRHAREAAQKVSDYFDLMPEFLEKVERTAQNKLTSYTSIYKNQKLKTLHAVFISKEKIRIYKIPFTELRKYTQYYGRY